MRRQGALLLAAVLAIAAPGTPLAADVLQLQKSVRTLASLQDRAANGDAEAARLQTRLITQIENDIRLSPDDMLRNPHNLRALAMLLLSGANPNLVEAQTLNLPMDDNMRNLITGGLAYARADREGAAKFLAKVDVGHLPPSLAGRVALVRSIIGASDNAVRAIDDLYTARELMPGTLVEEASLRRCVAFAGRVVDKGRLRFCSGRYIRRFPNSLYFKEFEVTFAEAVAQTGLGEGKEIGTLLESLERLPTRHRREMLLRLARASLTHGRHALATNLAVKAENLSLAGSADMARARLYLAAAEVAGETTLDEAARLAAIDESRLAPDDAKLLADARRLAKQIAVEPGLTMALARMLAASSGEATEDAGVTGAIEGARKAISQSEQLIPPTPQQATP